MIKKLLALLLTLCITAGGFTLVALAAEGDDDLILIFEESFEEYEADVNVSSTLMPNFFINDANAIGDGYIKVIEAANGNLYLQSHVFTQVYSATPIVGAYEFSLDIHEAQGSVQTGVFVRASKTRPTVTPTPPRAARVCSSTPAVTVWASTSRPTTKRPKAPPACRTTPWSSPCPRALPIPTIST